MSKTDKELLKLAAKAVGIECDEIGPFKKEVEWQQVFACVGEFAEVYREWNPLSDDGDALRLAVDLGLDIVNIESSKQVAIWTNRALLEDVYQKIYNDKHATTRRAIVIAAAAIGEDME